MSGAPFPGSEKVAVVWPPVWNAFDPHVAVPSLCGYLVHQGVAIRQFDLNIDFFRYIASEPTIESIVSGRSMSELAAVKSGIAFAQSYFETGRRPLSPGYRQKFSDDAEALLLSNALAIFNAVHPEVRISTLGAYHAGAADDSDYLIAFAAEDAGNPFAEFYRTQFLLELEREMPKIVGISVCGPFQLGAALTLARMIKALEPRIHVVFGGAFFSTMPQMFRNPKTNRNLFRYVDAFILNEGEIPFLRHIRDVVSGEISPRPNVLRRDQAGWDHQPQLCLPPDEITMPVFPDGALEKYFRAKKRVPVEVSRGCYWGKCTFCNLAVGSNERYRGLPITTNGNSISRFVLDHDVDEVILSTLAMAPKLLRRLTSEIEANGARFRWSSWIRPERAWTRDDFANARKTGCIGLHVTPESFCDTTLTRMQKGVEAETLYRIMRDLQDVGLGGGINLIPGFPGESEDDFLSTLEVCQALGLRGEFFPFYLLKNSPIYNDPKKFDIVVEERDDLDLAMQVSFAYRGDAEALSGVELIARAAGRYPHNISAGDPLAGYTFDFSH